MRLRFLSVSANFPNSFYSSSKKRLGTSQPRPSSPDTIPLHFRAPIGVAMIETQGEPTLLARRLAEAIQRDHWPQILAMGPRAPRKIATTIGSPPLAPMAGHTSC